MQFVYINVIYLMLIPVLVLMFLILTKKNSFDKYFSKDILEKLCISSKYFSNKSRNIILFISLIFMIIALSRPVANEKQQELKQKLNAIVIAIDISKSMKASDIYPNRLEFAKKKLLDIIDISKTNAIAVVLFAKSSFILSPVTQDFTSLKILIENLDTGMNFDNGTNIYSTLETTNKLLKNYKNKNLILLSDGGDKKEFDEEIEFAKKNNISVYTISTATKQGAAIKQDDGNYLTDKNNNIVTVKLNEDIKNLSLETSAAYINYSLDSNDIKQILNEIDSKSKKEEFKKQKFKTYTELFYYPLGLGIFLLLIAFSSLPNFTSKNKKTIQSILFLALFFNINEINASTFDFLKIEEANKAYKAKNYEKAAKEYSKISKSPQSSYNLANSFYKEGKYKEAINEYKNIKTQDKDLNYQNLHNLGNSYVKNKNLEEAKKAYENALKIKDDKQTKENLDLVNKALKEKQEKQEKQENQNNQSNQDKQNNKNKKDKQNDKNDKNDKNNQSNQDKENDKENKQDKQKKQGNNNKQNNQKNQLDKKVSNKSEISDLEEEKWFKQLENQKTNSLLKKIESQKEENNNLENPW